MTNRILAALTLTLILTPIAALATPPTNAQKCTSDVEKASGKFAQCKLNAESSFTKTGDSVKLTAALAKCATTLQTAFGKATTKYLGACPMTEPEAAFDAYLSQCSDDTTAVAGGATLPDYVGELASCNADLTTCQGDLAICQAEPHGQRLETGQTTCWTNAGSVIPCAGTGQDGELHKGLARAYVDNGDGTITDTKTGLMWEKLADDGSIHDKDNTYTWTLAVALKVPGLNGGGGFAGHTDWRLPNVNELQSLVNYGAGNPAVSPAFNTGCVAGCTVLTCSCTLSGIHWSSSSDQLAPNTAWTVDFFEGRVDPGGPKALAYPLFVRAVRGGS